MWDRDEIEVGEGVVWLVGFFTFEVGRLELSIDVVGIRGNGKKEEVVF